MLTHASFLTHERRVTNGAVTVTNAAFYIVTLLAAVLSTFQDLAMLISGLGRAHFRFGHALQQGQR